jgi:hypothetical protein
MSSKLYGSNPITAAQMTLDMHERIGGVYVANTATITGRFGTIQALTATVIATITTEAPGQVLNSTKTSGTITNVTLPAGSTFKGNITTFALTSGSVIAYNAP